MSCFVCCVCGYSVHKCLWLYVWWTAGRITKAYAGANGDPNGDPNKERKKERKKDSWLYQCSFKLLLKLSEAGI